MKTTCVKVARAISFLGFSKHQSTCLHAYSVLHKNGSLSLVQFHCICEYITPSTADQMNTFKCIYHGLILMHPHQVLPTPASTVPHSSNFVLDYLLACSLYLYLHGKRNNQTITKTSPKPSCHGNPWVSSIGRLSHRALDV